GKPRTPRHALLRRESQQVQAFTTVRHLFELLASQILTLGRRYERELVAMIPEEPNAVADMLPDSIAQLRREIDNLVKCQQDNREARTTLINRLSRNAEETL